MTMTEGAAEPWVVEQHWDLTYRHAADPAASKFFRTLLDEGHLIATRCPQCERVLFPPRSFCDRDFCPTEGWVEVGNEGVVELFTIMYHAITGLPEPPYAIAYVRPDGADTAAVNFVYGVDLSDPRQAVERLRIGARVRIRVRLERQGRVTDFYYEVIG